MDIYEQENIRKSRRVFEHNNYIANLSKKEFRENVSRIEKRIKQLTSRPRYEFMEENFCRDFGEFLDLTFDDITFCWKYGFEETDIYFFLTHFKNIISKNYFIQDFQQYLSRNKIN